LAPIRLKFGSYEPEGIDGTARVGRDGGVEAGRGRQNANRGDVLENQAAGIDVTLATGQGDIEDPSGGLDQVEGQGRQVCCVGGIDDRVKRLAGEVVLRPDVLEPEAAGVRE
jgi:hypothetical protein